MRELAALQQLQTVPSTNTFVTSANGISSGALKLSGTVNPILAAPARASRRYSAA